MSELELWNEMGNMYYFAGAYDEAIRTYSKVITLDPGYAQSYSNLATILVTQARHADAIPMFRKAIELTEDKISRAFLWKQMGDAFRILNDNALASEAYKNAMELVPEDASLQVSLADLDFASQVHPSEPLDESSQSDLSLRASGAENAGSLELEPSTRTESGPSEIAAGSSVEIAPESPSDLPDASLTRERGNAYWMFIDNETEQQVLEISSAAPNPPPAMPGSQMPTTLPVESAPDETQATSADPDFPALDLVEASKRDDPAGLPSLGNVSQEEEPSPIAQPDSCILGNVSPYALLRLGILHWRNKEYERAAHFLDFARVAASRAQDQFLQALCHDVIARLQTDLGRIEAAIRSYQSAANLAPDRIFPWNNLGNLNSKLGKYEAACAAFQKAIEHNPKDPCAWNGLGDVYHKLGLFEDAIAAYQNGNVFGDQQIEEDVLKAFERAIDSEQQNPLVWNEAGHIYFSLDAFEDAAASYRQAIQLDPSNSTFQANLARTLQVQEQVQAQDCSSTPDILKEMDLDTQPLPRNFMDEIVSPKPEKTIVIETHPEIIAQVKPFLPETNSPQLERPYGLRSNSSTKEPAKSAGFVLKQNSVPSDPPVDPRSDSPYSMLQETQPRGNPRPAGYCFVPAITETLVSTDKPIPAFDVRPQPKLAFSGSPVLTDVDQEHFNGLVQMTPRPQRPSWSDEVIKTPAVNRDWGTANLDEDAISRRSALVDSQNGVPIREFVKPASQPAPQPVNSKETDIAACLRVTEINPCNDRAWDALGNKYEAAGLYSEAIGAYEQAIILSPQKEVYYYHLGIALAYMMRYDKAILALEKVLSLNPKYTLAHCALAGYYRKLGREEDARKLVALARPCMETETEYNQACFESISGDADRALELLEIAFEKKQVQPGMIQNDPDLDFIRTDPRFDTLLAKNGILRQ
jgi:tetratricopeptide (TPR) repeat protein